jgi:dihydrofolate reductase
MMAAERKVILYISVIPVLLGEGTRLFKDGRPEQRLSLVDSKYFDTGLVQLYYIFNR